MGALAGIHRPSTQSNSAKRISLIKGATINVAIEAPIAARINSVHGATRFGGGGGNLSCNSISASKLVPVAG